MMYRKKAIFFLFSCFFLFSAFTTLPPEKPQLIISIVLDNVSLQDIERNRDLLCDDGLLKLKNEGTALYNVTFPYSASSKATDYASFATGSTPSSHGIIGNHWYNKHKDKLIKCTHSKSAVLIGSTVPEHTGTAEHLLASTFSDELKLNAIDKNKVYSVSLFQEAAILLAGHSADGAFWLDSKSGKWVSSDYYLSWLPDWTKAFNNKNFSKFYLDQEWTLSYSPSTYDHDQLIFRDKTFPFSLMEHSTSNYPYNIIKSTPMGNMFVTDFCSHLIKEEKLGKHQYVDYLSINYSSISNKNITNTILTIEKIDHLVKLDKEIARLLEHINKEVGLHNCLIILTSTQSESYSNNYLSQQKVPNGTFDPEKAMALLNSYLMALHGQGNWLLNYSNKQFYLNKELIKKSRLNFKEFQEEVADFLEEFAGIQWAIPAYHLKYSNSNTAQINAMKAAYFAGRSGDIMIELAAGWTEKNSTLTAKTISVPLFFYGWKMERNQFHHPIEYTDITPTLSKIINIPGPNSSNNNLIIPLLSK